MGANLDAGRGIYQALERIAHTPGLHISAISSLYTSPPWGGAGGGRYFNAVALVDSEMNPWALMARCLHIERELGRMRGRRYAPRCIDLDLLCAPHLRVNTPRLCLPHPQMLLRRFVLQPLCDLAPNWVLAPGLRARAALLRCPDRSRLVRVRELPRSPQPYLAQAFCVAWSGSSGDL